MKLQTDEQYDKWMRPRKDLKPLSADINDLHIRKLIDFSIEWVRADGGDGNILIICKNYDFTQLGDCLLNTLKTEYSFGGTVEYTSTKNDRIYSIYGNCDQESWIITNDIDYEWPLWENVVYI